MLSDDAAESICWKLKMPRGESSVEFILIVIITFPSSQIEFAESSEDATQFLPQRTQAKHHGTCWKSKANCHDPAVNDAHL